MKDRTVPTRLHEDDLRKLAKFVWEERDLHVQTKENEVSAMMARKSLATRTANASALVDRAEALGVSGPPLNKIRFAIEHNYAPAHSDVNDLKNLLYQGEASLRFDEYRKACPGAVLSVMSGKPWPPFAAKPLTTIAADVRWRS